MAFAHDFVYEAKYVPLAIGADSNRPFDMNNRGQIVGETFTSEGMSGFVWEEGVAVRLLRGPANEQAFAIAINQSGVITGAYVGRSGYLPCVWTDGPFGRDLGLPNGSIGGLPVGICEGGQVYGNFEFVGGRQNPFRWTESGGTEVLPVIPFLEFNMLTGVGPADKALGFGLRRINSKGSAGPFVFNGFNLSFLPILDGFDNLVPISMNEHGEIAGCAIANRIPTPCVWSASGDLHTLSLPPGYEGGVALDINVEGTTVGLTHSPPIGWLGGHHGVLNLNLLFPPGGSSSPIDEAIAINDDGFILAKGPTSRAVLLTPKVVDWTEGQIAEMTRGKLVLGDDAALRTVDAKTATFDGGPTPARYAPGVEFTIEGTATFSNPNKLVFRAVARADRSRQARLQVQLWDWRSGRYNTTDQIDRDVEAPRFGLTDLVVTGDRYRFIEPVTKRMRARVRVLQFGDFFPLSVEFDQLSWFAG